MRASRATFDAMSEPDPEESKFDELRIRRTTVLRRGLYRSRSYAVTAAIGCAAAAAQCGYLIWQHARSRGWELRVILYVILMLTAVAGMVWFQRRAAALKREASRSHLPEPQAPPDFSTLSDGTQCGENLERLQ